MVISPMLTGPLLSTKTLTEKQLSDPSNFAGLRLDSQTIEQLKRVGDTQRKLVSCFEVYTRRYFARNLRHAQVDV